MNLELASNNYTMKPALNRYLTGHKLGLSHVIRLALRGQLQMETQLSDRVKYLL